MRLAQIEEYGCRVLTSAERLAIYKQRRGTPNLTSQAIGIEVKRRWIDQMNRIPKHRALVVKENDMRYFSEALELVRRNGERLEALHRAQQERFRLDYERMAASEQDEQEERDIRETR